MIQRRSIPVAFSISSRTARFVKAALVTEAVLQDTFPIKSCWDPMRSERGIPSSWACTSLARVVNLGKSTAHSWGGWYGQLRALVRKCCANLCRGRVAIRGTEP